jgi:hypothetical protein
VVALTMLGFLRFFAGVLFLIAVLAAVYDGTRSLAAHAFVTTSLFEHWSKLTPTIFNAAQNAVQRYSHPMVWEVGVRRLLLMPTWLLFALLGAVFAYAGRRRRRVNVFAN